MKNKNILGWFFFGLGTQLQIIASLSFAELFVFASAPIIFFKERKYMQRNGIMPFFWLSMAVFGGCCVAIVANHTSFQYALRGLAVTSLLPCTVVVGHWMLRRDMSGFKWMLVGGAISDVLSTFIFQKSVEVSMLAGGQAGDGAAEAIMAGPIYWITRLGAFVNLVPKGWYLQCPIVLSVLLPLFMAGFSILTSASGRSAALGAIGAVSFVILGGKKPSTIRRNICNKFWLLVVLGVIGIFTAKFAYETLAEQGWLGEDARTKYENQTKGDKSLKALILGGRMASFCGLIACVDKPIIGFGPWAMDRNGYTEEFLSKYADYEDYMNFINLRLHYAKYGGAEAGMISCHAYITEFWCWYGIFGLLFWLYIIFVLLRYLRQDCWAVPQWYMWLAASIPGYFWGIFFSPWSARVTGVMFVVACLMVRAVRFGKQQLPTEMLVEIRKVEGR